MAYTCHVRDQSRVQLNLDHWLSVLAKHERHISGSRPRVDLERLSPLVQQSNDLLVECLISHWASGGI